MILDALRLFLCLNRIVRVKVTGFYDRVHYCEITGQKGSPKSGRLKLNLHTYSNTHTYCMIILLRVLTHIRLHLIQSV